MKGLNKVQLIGNLGNDPEIRLTPKEKSGHFSNGLESYLQRPGRKND